MNQGYPYLETVCGIDESIRSYSIQPISEGEEAAPEEDPILAFGPLGKINIFVGATNAGKSRFLRLLANSQGYAWLPSAESHKQYGI